MCLNLGEIEARDRKQGEVNGKKCFLKLEGGENPRISESVF